MEGIVFDIQRMSVHDGPGIRTTVFLKGCPLRCLWCHNPESHRAKPELAFCETQCIGCGVCLDSCANGCHTVVDGLHVIDRAACTCCGRCARECTGALAVIGRSYTVDEVMRAIRRDVSFYQTSGGGVTVSGGEPLMQPDFAYAILAAAQGEGLHTCLETTGYAREEVLLKIASVVDLVLYDFKETDSDRHLAYTGGRNEKILENLFALDRAGKQTILRCPIIPGLNDREAHLRGIAALANRLRHVQMIHIEPYNSFGEGKCRSIGREYALGGLNMPEPDVVVQWIDLVRADTDVPVVKS